MVYSLYDYSNSHTAHRKALNAAVARINEQNPPSKRITIIVSTRNMVKALPRALLGMKTVVQLTGFGRLYTDYGFPGRLCFYFGVWLMGLYSACAFIVENDVDRAEIARITRRPVFTIHGSGLNVDGFTRKRKKRGKRLRLGYLSRFHRSKGTVQIIDAIKRLPKNRELFIAGWDITGDVYSRSFASLAEQNPNVHFIGRLESPARVSDFFNSIDVLLAPSVREGLNVALQEAIWHKVPFVTTTSPGCRILAEIFQCPAIEIQDYAETVFGDEIWSLSPDTTDWDKLLTPFMAEAVEEEFVTILLKVASREPNG